MIGQLLSYPDRWLRQPARSAAGRMGWFRIVFSLFYLWHLSYVDARLVAFAPPDSWHPILIYQLLGRPPEWLPAVWESFLAGFLVLLLFGVKTRVATGFVLLLGVLQDGFLASFGKVEHATVILTFYIPFIMLFSTWGETHAVDAGLRRLKGSPVVSPDDQHWRHIWPMRLVLLLLSFLFLTAALSKWLLGPWASDPQTVAHLALNKYYLIVLDGLSPKPFVGVILGSSLVAGILSILVPLFEGLFPLSLIQGTIRHVYLSLAVLFHAMNALFLGVTFTPVLIAYGIVVNWERIGTQSKRLWRPIGDLVALPEMSRTTRILVLIAAVALAIDWNVLGFGRLIFSFAGTLDWQSIWYPAGIVAIATLCRIVFRALK